MRMKACFTGFAVLAILLTAATDAYSGSCEPKFGDQILAWVSNTAGKQSHQLAEVDYEARTFNYFIVGYDDLNKRVLEALKHLGDASATMRTNESGLGDDPIKQAVGRQSSSTKLLNDLYRVRAEIDEIAQRRVYLQSVPTEALFVLQGLHNVGRATLLESLQQLGDSAQKSLASRYSTYVSVTVDNGGNVSKATVTRSPDMVDSVVTAAASYLPNPYSIAVVLVFEMGREMIDGEACRKKVEEQHDKVRKAYQILPTVLITREELFKLYSEKYSARLKEFDSESVKVAVAAGQLDATWKELFTYNMARSQTANIVLTTEKIKELEQQYSGSGDTEGIYNNVALSRIAQKTAELNGYVSGKQARILFACGNLDGYVAFEDQADTLAYTEASLNLFRGRAEFVPLLPLVEKSMTAVAQATGEVNALRGQLAAKPCNQPDSSSAIPMLSEAARQATTMSSSLKSAPMKPRTSQRQPKVAGKGLSMFSETSFVPAFADAGGSLCVLIRNGVTYSCEAPGSPGASYGAGFDGTHGDPRYDVLGGANDGGYASDNRRVGGDIAAVTSNVNARIAETKQRAADAKAAFGDWNTKNGAFLDTAKRDGIELDRQSIQDLQTFKFANAAALAGASAKLDDFLKQPADPSRTADLVRLVNARDVGLPSLASDRIPVDAPVLPGVSARDRIYEAATSEVDQRIARETQKIQSLNAKPELKNVAENALSAARRFAANQGGQILAQMLVKDSASIRYFGTGQVNHMEITVVGDDGQVSRAIITDPNALPSDSLIERARRFDDDRAFFDVRAKTVQDIIDQGQGTPIQRSALLQATTLSTAAHRAFYGGDVVTGAQLMQFAMVVLDVATSLTPGVSWGRDIYEAVTGLNLISGEELSVTERTIAVLGAVTGGVAGEGPKIIRAIEHVAQIGEAGERAEHILQAASRIDHTLELSIHAEQQLHREEMIAHQLGRDNVDAALDRGTRFWDVDQKTIVSFEEQAAEGEWRAVAPVDPDNMIVTTVYATDKSDAALALIPSLNNDLVRRYRRLPGD